MAGALVVGFSAAASSAGSESATNIIWAVAFIQMGIIAERPSSSIRKSRQSSEPPQLSVIPRGHRLLCKRRNNYEIKYHIIIGRGHGAAGRSCIRRARRQGKVPIHQELPGQ